MRDQALCEGFFGHVPREIVAAKSEIKNYSAPLGFTHDR